MSSARTAQASATRTPRRLLERPELVASLTGLVWSPLLLAGYGTDIDVANVLRAGRSWLEGEYQISRNPGSTPVELVTALLDRIGGAALANLPSLLFAVLGLACLGRILQREGVARSGLVVLVAAANPWLWIAATSLGDFTWALGLLLAGVDAAQRGRRAAAGALFGLAIGARLSTALLVAAWLLAERLGRQPARVGRVGWGQTGWTAILAAGVAAVCFVPPYLARGGFGFLATDLELASPAVQVGRWAVKNLAVIGLVGAVVALVGWRHVRSALACWSASPAVRFGVLGFAASEALFLRLPLKPVHLLPALACAALIAGSSRRPGAHRWLWALVAAQLLHGVVSVRIAAPDRIDAATGGRLAPAIVTGVVLNDVGCRLADLDAGPWPDPADPAQRQGAEDRALANFTCQQRPWRPATRNRWRCTGGAWRSGAARSPGARCRTATSSPGTAS